MTVADAKPAVTKAADTKAADTKAADAKTADTRSRASKVVDTAEKPPEKSPPLWETAKAERRSGFAMGLSVGGGLGASNGYPNDSKKIGRAKYYNESGVGFGTGSAIWLGGALTDWLNLGIGFGFSNLYAKGSSSPAPLAFFHNDLYPLYPLKGLFRDVGATFEFGLGFPKTVATKTQVTLIDGAGSSYLFAGAFWEPLKVWKLRMGPYAGAHYLFSESVRRPLALVGFRLTLYAGP